MAIILSEAAASEIRNVIRQQELSAEKARLRVGVKGGGCAGFNYILDLTEEDGAGESDERMDSHGITILCDMISYLYLDGTEIDFLDDGAIRRGFVFKNPNPSNSCGCSSSFAR